MRILRELTFSVSPLRGARRVNTVAQPLLAVRVWLVPLTLAALRPCSRCPANKFRRSPRELRRPAKTGVILSAVFRARNLSLYSGRTTALACPAGHLG